MGKRSRRSFREHSAPNPFLLKLLNGVAAGRLRCFPFSLEAHGCEPHRSWDQTLTCFLRDQGKTDEARQLLGRIFGRFTEGFDTPDIKDAKALLDELS